MYIATKSTAKLLFPFIICKFLVKITQKVIFYLHNSAKCSIFVA